MATHTCPHDGSALVHETRDIAVRYKSFSQSVALPGWYCPVCGEGVHTAGELKAMDKALNELKASAEGLLPPIEIKRIRKKLHLTQQAAGTVIGGGPRAFQKYESGELLPSRAVVSALRLLDASPGSLAILRGQDERAKSA